MALNGRKAEASPFDRVDACIRDLQDRHDYWCKITRSAATREAAMAGIVGELEGYHLPLERLDIRCLTIFALAGVSIKKGTPTEARLAYRAAGLLLLTLRDGSPGLLLDAAFPALSKAIQAPHDDDVLPMLVAAAIDCLSVASFAGARHEEEARRSMDAIWRVIVPPARSRSKTSPVLLAAAVTAWTFLLTTIVSATSAQRNAGRASWSAAIASLVELLGADDRRVRMAAGEALAVCVELNLTLNARGRGDMNTLKAKVSDLAVEPASKRADNSLLREQKELFSQIAAFLDHGEFPATSWEWNGMMKVSTWARLVQLNFLRKFLGDGFLQHVQRNPLLNEAFSFGRVEGKPLSIQKEKRSMPIDDFLRDWKPDRNWSWENDNILCLRRKLGLRKCLPEKLLQLGWR
ncbi:unnamed protein product [Urochloa decumbens]|uniref:Interferon-related developmental regulator N-terminal domain-containing protein n=1 Tax=Urochloa decumbens TaxID=240449 RepID=A0ABC9D7D6_9POAL